MNQRAFDTFIQEIEDVKQRLYRIAYQYFNDQSTAVEAVDEAVFKAYKNIHMLRQPEYFKTWITRILINVCKKELIRKNKEIPLEEISDSQQEVFDHLPLKEAIRKLPNDLRIIIILRYFNDLTVVETADILKLPQGTVATRQRKALSLLRLELEVE